LGFKYPKHAVVEVSDKTTSLGLKNTERAVVEVSDKNIINKEQSKVIMQVPFRTDIRGEINTEKDRAIYSKTVSVCSIGFRFRKL